TNNNQLMAKRLIEQTLTNWVNPELERRKSAGELKSDFILKAAQIIFSVGGKNVVRINGEVKAIVEAKVNHPIKKGEAIFSKDVEDIRSFRLVDEEKDFGHITIVHLTKGWFVGFSFIYDVSKSKQLYDIAIEFMKSAHSDLDNKRYRPFVESALVAAENLAKARIYLIPDQEIRKAKTHGLVHGKVNSYARTDSIIKIDYKDGFNKLIGLRDKARYEPEFKLNHVEAEKLFKSLTEMSKEIFIYLVKFGEIEK
ncbi:MAG: HEPN domain-containing protein, partial [bacterium]|nr:HEPN domain-containing protein [bacterium]